MPLFQKSVIKKYLKELNSQAVQQSWQLFKAHFQNSIIQQHIKDSKEEEYQEGFVRDFFVTVLGYTLKPQPNFNFVLEQKSTTDATKSDGAIWKDGAVTTVVELKDTYTTELDKVEKQAFGYKHQHKDCIYIITSNFEKLRFYINDATNHIEFNLFTLTETEFQLLYLCLHSNQLLNNVPLSMKLASVTEEENITQKLYSDYSRFKQELFTNIASNNTQHNKLELFKKTQKLLDRLLFVLFAEDRLLVPPNSVRVILADWEKLKELDNYVPLYDRFKKYFGYLNTGHEGKQYEIYAYNGGLFAPDEILDSIKINDELLYNGCKILSDYDFESEVDVNILGHIFEHSLSEIEEVQAQLAGTAVEKTKTKRKKDGVFYTPRYITKYIVENTLGVLCEEKKKELAINNEVFEYRKRKDKKRETLVALLDTYRQWLFQLTICDPACGSGAFLNQALEFLIAEHSYVDELKAKLFGDLMILTDVETTILENNLFGVDINEEAVEIARLSLWLRTARKGRKLNNLSENIKCGNSLIDDPAVAGDKAFNWQKEFPQVFGEYKEVDITVKQKATVTEKLKQKHAASEGKAYTNEEDAATTTFNTEKITNYDNAIVNTDFKIVNEPVAEYGINKQVKKGFDVVIGNPPYGIIISETEQFYYSKNFPLTSYKINLYVLFLERVFKIFAGSQVCFIIPKSLLFNSNYSRLRKYFLEHLIVKELFSITEKVFEDAEVGSSLIVNFMINPASNVLNNKTRLVSAQSFTDYPSNCIITEQRQKYFLGIPNYEISIVSNDTSVIRDKILKFPAIKEDFILKNGLNPGNIKHVLVCSKKVNENHKPIVWGKDINRYLIEWSGEFVNYDEKVADKLTLADTKSKEGMKSQPKIDFALRSRDLFEIKKILVRKTGDRLICSIDESSNFYFDTLVHGIYSKSDSYDLKYLLVILNSEAATRFYRILHDIKGKVFAKISLDNLASFPIPFAESKVQQQFISKAETMLSKNKELQLAKKQLQKLLLSKYEGLILSKKLENWPSLSFKDFLKELSKQKIKLTLTEEAEWLNYFEEQKAKANEIKQVIDATDKEIDKMVYQLYGLTAEEIKIVEGQ